MRQFGPPIALALFCLAAAAIAAPGDWSQWRGPKGDGISTETGLMKEWPAGGPALAWKVTGLGAGYSGVSVAAGRIYTMGDGADASYIRALNAADGKLVWSAQVGATGGGGGYPGPRCTPTVDGDLVYALNQHGDLVCVRAAAGQEVWRKNLRQDFRGKMMSGWGNSESPLVDGDRLLCTPGGQGGTVLALNKKSGATLWQSQELTDSATYASLVAADIGGVHQYVVLTDASVAGVAADTGKLLWRAERRGRTAVVPTPVVSGNFVFVTSGYGVGCNLFKVTAAGGAFQAEQVYANTAMVNHHGGVILVGEHLYGHSDSRGWVCMSLKTGDVVWADRGVGKGAVTCADGRLYMRSESGAGTMALVEATPAGYKESGRFDQPDRSNQKSWPHPVVAGGRLYVRDQDVLLCYNVKGQ